MKRRGRDDLNSTRVVARPKLVHHMRRREYAVPVASRMTTEHKYAGPAGPCERNAVRASGLLHDHDAVVLDFRAKLSSQPDARSTDLRPVTIILSHRQQTAL